MADAGGDVDPQALPKEFARRQALHDQLDTARRHLETAAKARAEAERGAYEAKVAARNEHKGRANGKHPKPPKEPRAEWRKSMAGKLSSEEGHALDKLRQQTAEPVFGIIKAILSFTRFSVQGKDKMTNEWNLVALAYNCERLHKLQLEIA